MKSNALIKACGFFNSRDVLAKKIGASTAQLTKWINRDDKIPYHYAIQIVEKTNNVITLNELCDPDETIKLETNKLLSDVLKQQRIKDIAISAIHTEQNHLLETMSADLNDVDDCDKPLLLDETHHLITCIKQFQKYQKNHCKVVPVLIVDLEKHIQKAELIQGIRDVFSRSERAAIGEAVERRLDKCRGRPKGKKKWLNWSNFNGRYDELAARIAGFNSRATYQRVKKVCDTRNNDLIKAMNNKSISIYRAATIARLPEDEQKIHLNHFFNQ